MRHITILCCLATLIWKIEAQRFGTDKPPQLEPLAGVSSNWFSQILDHDKRTNLTYWQQKYFVNDQFYRKLTKSPVFIKIGGEGAISEGWMTGGSWVTYGRKYGALLFQLEHRYYGESHPTEDASVENLKYLTSEQALADIAYFIESIRTNYSLTTRNRFIVFGGSYSGNLAAWARLKHPKQVYGAVASSAPVMAEADFKEFYQVLNTSLEVLAPGCSNPVHNATLTIQEMLTTAEGISNLKTKLSLCGDFDPNNVNDVATLIQSVTNNIVTAVQYNAQPVGGPQVDPVCKIMLNTSIPLPIDRLAEVNNQYRQGCSLADYQSSVVFYNESAWDSDAVMGNARQWIYQTCNEFGFYQTSSTEDELFSNTLPLSFFTDQCTDVFGKNFNPQQLEAAVAATNQKYGGTNINARRVAYLQGSIDPWHALGMVPNKVYSPSLYINGTSHCADTNTPSYKDPPSLTAARATVDAYIGRWLSQ